MLRAGWNPIQIEALTILTERIASPKEVAVELGLTSAKAGFVSRHIRELEKRGLVELARTEPRRGAMEHFYKAIEPLIVMDDEAERMSFEERLIYSCWIISRISGDFALAVDAGTIDERTDRHLSRFPLRLDEEGYRDLIEEYSRTFHRTLQIEAECEGRLAASEESGMPFSAMLACFPTPQLPPDFRGGGGALGRLGGNRGAISDDDAQRPNSATLRTVQVETNEVTSRMLRAGWHPIQIEALTVLTERIASPKEVAIQLGHSAGKAGHVSHHIRELQKRGLVELVHTEPRRGAIEHFYRAIEPLLIMDHDAERMSFEERLIYTCWIISRISDDLLAALETGTIDERTDRHLSRFPLLLDEEAYGAIIEEFGAAFHRTLEIQTESEDRLARSETNGKPFSAVLACFPMPRVW